MLKTTLGLAVWIGLLSYAGWALVHLWSWYMVPLGVVSINIPWGIGLMCIASLFKTQKWPEKETNPQAELFLQVFMVTLALVVGYAASKLL